MRWAPARPAHPRGVADPGLQGERTYLSWQRTGLSFAAIGGGLVHFSESGAHLLPAVVGLCGLAAGAVVVAMAMPRYRHSALAAQGHSPAALPRAVLVTCLTTVALGVGALVVTLT